MRPFAVFIVVASVFAAWMVVSVSGGDRIARDVWDVYMSAGK